MKETFTAWAIDTRSIEGHGFIGRYWWFNGLVTIPKHLLGCKIALFTTRQLARQNLPGVRRAFPNARVVRVSVNIEVL
mgnify:FL=1